MNKISRQPNHAKLSTDAQFSVYLIKEELKSRKVFNSLYEAGIDDCYFQPHLDSLIMKSIGLDDGTDETFSKYDKIIERRSRKIEAHFDSITRQAMMAYEELITEKKKMSAKKKLPKSKLLKKTI